jgi:hypothetical protein
MKALQEIDGYAEITNRRPTPRPTVLYLMALRMQSGNSPALQRKLTIPVRLKDSLELPRPVRITHLRPGDPGLPVVID